MQSEIGDLYHVSYRRLVAQVYAFTTDLTEAQDAVQEAFARAIARRGQLSDVDSPEAWLRTVAVNIVRRRWRRKQLLNTILLRERPLTKMLEDAPEPDRADLREALAALSRPYREVIVLHYLADLPVDEVAAILEVPVGTVKSRLSRGREALKGLLDDVEAPPLETVRRRASHIRAHRRVAQASAALAVVCVSAIGFFVLQPPQLPTLGPSPTPGRSVLSYSGSGLTILSVPDPSTVPDLDGTIIDVDVDGQDVLVTDTGVYARSTDFGATWVVESGYLPKNLPPWQAEQWPAELGEVRWAFPRPTAAGVWWVQTSTKEGKLAFAYSATPKDGSSWRLVPLDLPAAEQPVPATVAGDKVIAIIGNFTYRVDAQGFERGAENPNMPQIRGEPIFLPDSRLLAAGGASEWLFSEDLGQTWLSGDSKLGAIGSLRATSDGYAAYDFLRAGWVLTSADGVRWQKLPVH